MKYKDRLQKDYIYLLSSLDDKVNAKNLSYFFAILRLQLIKFFTSGQTYVLLFIFPLTIALVTIVIAPDFIVFAALIPGSLAVSTFFIFGMYFINTNEISYFSVLKINNEKYLTLGTTFILIVISNILFTAVSIFYVFALTAIFDQLFIFGLWSPQISITITFLGANWAIFLYFLTLQTILLFLIAFFLYVITSNINTYMFLIVIYLFFSMIIGGLVFTNYFGAIHELTNSGWYDENGVWTVNSDNIYIKNDTIYLNPGTDANEIFTFKTFFSNLFPTFYLNQLMRFLFVDITTTVDMNIITTDGNNYIPAGSEVKINYFQFSNISWSYLLINPYIWIGIFTSLDLYLYIYKK